jgi:hypothetical protein
MWEVEVGGSRPRLPWGKSMRLYLKNKPKLNRAGGMAQMVEHLLGKPKALSSKPVLPIHFSFFKFPLYLV